MLETQQIPRDKGFDHTLDLLREGYLFISNRCRRYETDVFQTRFLGVPVICMSGEEAAKLFYDTARFQRKGAIPKRLQKTMIGAHTVQTLDGAAHQHRKQLFLKLVNPDRVRVLTKIAREEWQAAVDRWERQEKIVLFTEARKLLYRTACLWTGVPLHDSKAQGMAEAFGDLVGALGAVTGPRYREGKRSRKKLDRWLTVLVESVRSGELQPDNESALVQIAMHRDLDGNLLDSRIAAAELNTMLHTIVSVSIYVTFGALAFHEHPRCRGRMLAENAYMEWFIHEVRRFYPFGPFIGARVRQSFTWNGYTFSSGTYALLDIYGTNRDPRVWEQPNVFWPERFQGWQGNKFAMIPHGGGDEMGHRCAGEGITMELLKVGFTVLVKDIACTVCQQDVGYSLRRMPTVPRDGLVLSGVRRLMN